MVPHITYSYMMVFLLSIKQGYCYACRGWIPGICKLCVLKTWVLLYLQLLSIGYTDNLGQYIPSQQQSLFKGPDEEMYTAIPTC